MKKICLVLIGLLPVFLGNAQWTSIINPSSSSTYGTTILMDNVGNIYSIGYVFVNSTEKENIIVVKYNNSGTELWTRIYDHAENSDKPASAVVDADNNLIIAATTTSSANGNDILCLKYDEDGELTNTYIFDGTAHLDDNAVDILIGENGNLYIGGTSRLVSQRAFVLIKTDSELGDIWQKTHTLYYGADLRKIHFNSATQNIAITGNYTDWENLYLSAVVVYDKDGNKIFDEYYRTLENRSAVGFDVIANHDNTVYVCGYESNEETNLWDALLMKYDAVGEITWSKKVYAESLPAVFKSIITDNSGNVYVTGMSGDNAITAKYEPDGNLLWMQTHSSKMGFSTVDTHESIKQSDDGDIFITARNLPANGGGAMLVKYNGDGEHQWSQYYNGSPTQMDEPLSFCLDNQGNSYMILNSRNVGYYFDMVTVKLLNQSGQLSPMFNSNVDISVYPNPAHSDFFIENTTSDRIEIKIYSVEGKCVYQTVSTDNLIQIYVDDLHEGCYVLELFTGNSLQSKKLRIVR
jgi:hypothetical protein